MAGSLFAVLVLIGVIINAGSPPTPTPASQHKPAAAASPSPSPSVTSRPAVIESSAAAATTPATTQPAQQATTTQPAQQPTTQAPVGCRPLTNAGKCYEPGEFCRTSDHEATGVAGDGKTIICENNDGWRWEPTG